MLDIIDLISQMVAQFSIHVYMFPQFPHLAPDSPVNKSTW